jgi:cyclopropane fatty-acyl-phospholipid synthase-like methyltransferase
MAMSAVMSWLGRPMRLDAREQRSEPLVEPLATMDEEPLQLPLPSRPPLAWTSDRLATTDALWGDGYQFPGGEIETLRLAKPLGLSAASSLLLLGVGGGGPAVSVAHHLGAWVSGFESDPGLVAAAVDRIFRLNLTKRIQIEIWKPEQPNFRPHFYHHGLALEPLHGSNPERTLSAISGALKPNGHLMMLEVVADVPLDPANPIVASWARLDCRDPGTVPTEVAITRILRRLRFDVRVVEDVSERHTHEALTAWRTAVRTMEDVRPTSREAMRCIQEAELWLLRLRLFQMGLLRLVRWHAIGGGS